MSYFKHDADQSRYASDRLPIYVCPAFVGSGRILLGMALAGITTAVLMHSTASGDPMYWWLAGAAYVSSLVLVVSGLYAVNIIPEERKRPQRPLPPPSPPRRVKPLPKAPVDEMPAASEPAHRTRIGDLLVEKWQLLSAEQLARALGEQEDSGHSLIYVLARMGLLTDEGLEQVLDVQSAAADPWRDSPRHG